ncbi:hypothetical protein V8G54_008537 [Vigna mungo]|uniref:Uncharacterized protein n=1 Tax=Vigna mungo TaxID=3915 RepID=A0AAQ3P427_VIGMU
MNHEIVEHMLFVDVPLHLAEERRERLVLPHMDEKVKDTLRLMSFSSTLKAINYELLTRQRMKDHEGKIPEAKVVTSTVQPSPSTSTLAIFVIVNLTKNTVIFL